MKILKILLFIALSINPALASAQNNLTDSHGSNTNVSEKTLQGINLLLDAYEKMIIGGSVASLCPGILSSSESNEYTRLSLSITQYIQKFISISLKTKDPASYLKPHLQNTLIKVQKYKNSGCTETTNDAISEGKKAQLFLKDFAKISSNLDL